MTAKERIKEISTKCGLSENIVREVLKAETESAADSLIKGENAVLLGRCIIKPKVKDDEIHLYCVASSTLKNIVEESDIDKESVGKELKFKNITKLEFEELL